MTTDPQRNASLKSVSIKPMGMIASSIRFYRWTMVLVAIGAAATTAVIVGALLVGDSVRGSMRNLIFDRLGRIEHMVLAHRFINADAAVRMGSSRDYPKDFDPPVPAILFPNGTAERRVENQTRRAGSILVVGSDESFWKLNEVHPSKIPTGREVVLNEALAAELGAKVGDEVTLRLPTEQAVPADSPLGKRDEQSQSLPRLEVVSVIPNKGLGRFDLRASQKPPRNAYVSLELIQETLDRDHQINSILIARKSSASHRIHQSANEIEAETTTLLNSMAPTLTDLGIQIERVRKTFPDSKRGERPRRGADALQDEQVAFDYYHITSEQLLIPPAMANATEHALAQTKQQPVLTYLANAIEKIPAGPEVATLGDSAGKPPLTLSVPYSTISAIDSGPTFSFAPNDSRSISSGSSNSLAAGTVAVNSWLAEQLSLAIGDRVRVYYFLPETVHGKEIEESFEATVANVLPITKPTTVKSRNREPIFDAPPTQYNDPQLTPKVPGITDQDSMTNWDVPFKMTRDVRGEDDEYWKRYGLTPKLFISLKEGQRLFGSRFGNVSSIRIDPSVAESEAALADLLLPEMRKASSAVGLKPISIRWQQNQAASGTTPFDALFISLSFFVIVAALILISLLFRLGVEQRASQWGLLLAIGWQPWQVRRLLLIEGAIVAAIGGGLGMLVGVGYAYMMIWGLSGWWVGAVQIAFLEFYAGPQSLILGWLIGWLVSLATIRWSISSLTRLPALRLLRDRIDESTRSSTKKGNRSLYAVAALIALAFVLLVVGLGLSGEARAGSFLGGAMLLVVAAVILFYRSLFKQSVSPASHMEIAKVESRPVLTLVGMASQSGRRNPIRSTLSVGMIAFASFLVLSMSLFQAKPTESAIGGFTYMAESSVPIAKGLSEVDVRRSVLGPEEDQLQGMSILSMRLRPGDDASCNNLYQANQPRVLGIRSDMAARDAELPSARKFPWAGNDKPLTAAEKASPFAMLEREGDGSREHPFATILDLNTAMWSLHQGASVGAVFSFTYDDREIYFQTVGLMQNALLQGYLILGEQNFVKAFPNISGYQSFLIDDSAVKKKFEVVSILESGWGDEGLDLTKATSVLQSLLAVQNTYLSAFQVLGALGLLLGTFGLAVVQTRSVVERRGELALLRAVGYSRSRVTALLMTENAWLLLVGVFIGTGAAMAAVLPAWIGGQSLSDFSWPIAMLLIVIATGLLSGVLAVVRAGRLPILESLRGK